MRPIPRGIGDDRGLAVVHDADGVLVALDPATGEVRWRHGRGLRPCALAGTSVVAVSVRASVSAAGPPGLDVHVLARDDGRERWRAPAVVLPGWARPALDDTPQFRLAAAVDGDGVVLRWTATSAYAGGAAPSAAVLDRNALSATGAVRVDLGNRRVELHESAAGTAPAPADAAGGTVAGLRVELAVADRPAAAAAVVLRGIDPAAGDVRWQLTLDPAVRRGPPPLRQ